MDQSVSYEEKEEFIKEYLRDALNVEDLDDDIIILLQDSRILCKLVNHIKKKTIPRYMFMEEKLLPQQIEKNIDKCLSFIGDLGLPEDVIFDRTDLIEQRNREKVANCIYYVVVNHGPVKAVVKANNSVNLKFFWFPKVGEWILLPLIAGTALGFGIRLGRFYYHQTVEAFTK